MAPGSTLRNEKANARKTRWKEQLRADTAGYEEYKIKEAARKKRSRVCSVQLQLLYQN